MRAEQDAVERKQRPGSASSTLIPVGRQRSGRSTASVSSHIADEPSPETKEQLWLQ